ncbi:MAG: hypothetical protein AAGK22_08200 [Acidobacteriota bacterium]
MSDVRQSLGRYDDFEVFAVRTLEGLDLDRLVPMMDRAWKLDYAGEARQTFGHEVLKKLLRGDGWIAVLACTGEGAPIGVELALERQLAVGDRTLRTYYVTVFSVCPDHRRKGVGRRVLEGINRMVFEEEGAELIHSTFHEGYAGSPTVQSTFDPIEDFAVCRYHASPIWSRRLDKDPLPPLNRALRVSRAWCSSSTTEQLTLGPCGSAHPVNFKAPSIVELNEWVRSEFSVGFLFESSLRSQYLGEDGSQSGLLFYEFGGGGRAALTYNLMPMKIDDHPLKPVGQIQTVMTRGCAESHKQRLLHHAALYLRSLGCFAATTLDLAAVPTAVLRALGFRPLEEDLVHLAARGPAETVALFEDEAPPFFVDFT